MDSERRKAFRMDSLPVSTTNVSIRLPARYGIESPENVDRSESFRQVLVPAHKRLEVILEACDIEREFSMVDSSVQARPRMNSL